MADFNARVVLSAKNNAAAPMRQLRNDLRGLTDSFRGLGRNTGLRDVRRSMVDLGRTVGDIHRRHIRPMAASLAKIGGFTFGAGLAASAVGFTRTMNNAAGSIDKVSKASRKIDMDPNKLRAFAHVADLAGVSFESVETGMKGAARAFLEVQKGKGGADNKLKEFAPQLRFQMKMAKDTAEAASMALSAMHDAIDRGDEPLAQMIAETVFKSSDWMAIGEMTGEEVRKGIESALKLLGTLKPESFLKVEEFNDSLTDLVASWKGTRDAIAADLLPELTPIVKQWTDTFTTGRAAFVKDVGEIARTMASAFKELSFKGIIQDLREIADVMRELGEYTKALSDFNSAGGGPYQIGRSIREWLLGASSGLSGEEHLQQAFPDDGRPPLPRRARGGPLGAGQLAIVGEEGPELFAPRSAGHVFTASQTRAMMRQQMGGGTVSGLVRALAPLTDAIKDLTDAIKPMKLASLGGGPGVVGGLAGVRAAVRNGTITVPRPGGLGGVGTSPGSAKSLRDLIGRAEGTDRGRGYNETLGYGRFTGGDVDLTGMTLDEIDALQTRMLAHPDNSFNSSAVGRYQIVRKTLRGLRQKLGLAGSEKFDAKLQDRLADELIAGRRGQGVAGLRNEWEGLRKVSDAEILGALNAPASTPGVAAAGGPLAPLTYTNQRATRDQKLTPELERAIREGVAKVYGDGYSAQVYSGGQNPLGVGGKRTGSTRHDGGNAADIYVIGPDGQRVRGDQLAKLGQHWAATRQGGVGLEMRGGGIHLDTHKNRPPHWNYAAEGGSYTASQRAIMEAGLAGIPPEYAPRRNFARNLRPNMNRKSFEPAMRDRGAYAAAEVPAQKVEIGQGRFDIKVSLDQGLKAGGVSVRQPENIVANVGVDRTGSFKPPSGLKTGTRSDLRQPRV